MLTVNFVYGATQDSPVENVQAAVNFLKTAKDGDFIATGSDHFINTCYFMGVCRMKKEIQFQLDAENIEYEALNDKIVKDSEKASDILSEICDEFDEENGDDSDLPEEEEDKDAVDVDYDDDDDDI